MDTRREFLRNALFGFALVAVPGVAFANGVHPGFLFHPLGPGADLGLDWRLDRVFPPFEGAVTVNLVHADGRRARVDVCLREGAPKGPASTALLDFIVMDGGDGAAPMDESLGRVLRRLAAVVADNEGADLERVAQLTSHAQRVWAHPASLAAASVRLTPGAPTA
jgi:hypothetical protein